MLINLGGGGGVCLSQIVMIALKVDSKVNHRFVYRKKKTNVRDHKNLARA